MTDAMSLLDGVPPCPPSCTLAWEALIDVGDRQDLGAGPAGQRFIVPILGGEFRGGPGFEGLCGKVLAGGADRQTLRPDGVKELDALYEMQIEGSAEVLTLRNRVVIDEAAEGGRYAFSRIQVTAPAGRWDVLNRRLFLGTLQSARPARQAVIIRGWCVQG
ncbi:DUF3237 domain-containing protein [Pseudooceanicola sp. CBS1P-1]|uniref:DUF3237 family protein n=1 Tax=Pseudooceanicola albus TaxID=2692189 RepID=A0A6L7GBY5_9RHOB|nr:MULTISPECIES: DUF3237 family protein [Pseudooceanicola]MBT9386253.1 DUF3237 domain-containing protein [Pseudooceanicola endophyticus]MXN20303.1 DUF3237 family protein [Pseudooceanicola albus]